jgi:hypothetical protein
MKSFLVQTPFYKPLLTLRSRREYAAVQRVTPHPVQTVYCVSPYKTGTTYIAEHFGNFQKTAHEPLQYTTLHHLEDVNFMSQRASYLNNRLESSGFFAGRIETLRRFAPTAQLLSLYRPFDSWVMSFLNYFEKLGQNVSFNYLARLLFDPMCKHHVDRFSMLSQKEQDYVLVQLFEYWSNSYEDALNDDLTLIIPLNQVDDRIEEIAEKLNLENGSLKKSAWRRSSKDKVKINLSVIEGDPERIKRAKKIEQQVMQRLVKNDP